MEKIGLIDVGRFVHEVGAGVDDPPGATCHGLLVPRRLVRAGAEQVCLILVVGDHDPSPSRKPSRFSFSATTSRSQSCWKPVMLAEPCERRFLTAFDGLQHALV